MNDPKRTITARHLRVLVALVLGVAAMPAFGAGLNDTGITACWNTQGTVVSCTDPAALQGQDARFGRDAAAGTSALSKVGAGLAGFDFTKISNAGNVLPATASLGGAPNDWACTLDNVTGLMWEVKTTSGLRAFAHRYSWYSSNASTNGGGAGGESGGSCDVAGRCDSEKFTQDVNTAKLCNHGDWRMPTSRELFGMTRLSGSPVVDTAYFPNTEIQYYWSASPASGQSTHVWVVSFNDGFHNQVLKIATYPIRLVRRVY